MILEAALVVLGVAAIASAVFLAVRGVRSLSSLFLAGHLLAFGCFPILLVFVPTFFAFGAQFTVLYLFSTAFIFSFAVTYPALSLSLLQRWAVVWAFTPAFGYLAIFLVAPELIGARAVELAQTIIGLQWIGGTALFARRWLRAEPGVYRTQMLWALGPFLFWTVHDPIFVGYVGLRAGLAPASFWVRADTITSVVTIVFVLGIAAVAAARVLRGVDPDSRRLVVLIAVSFVASIPQFLAGSIPLANAIHLLIDAVSLLLLWYGVAKYRIIDVDVQLRRGVRQGSIAAIFVAVFFIASELAQQFLSGQYGPYVGVVAAGLLVLAMAPLQRMGERLGATALPGATGTQTYLAYRRMELYRVALEGALLDGHASPRESRALVALRDRLGITAEEHDLVENEARARLAR